MAARPEGIHDAGHWRAVYAQLAALADRIGTVGFIDVGGGLGVSYDPDAEPWCNTVLFDLYYLLGETSVMVAVPHGFGLSITEAVPEGRMPDAPQSAYIALRDGNYESYREGLNLEPVLALPEGMLYRNLDADCTETAQ